MHLLKAKRSLDCIHFTLKFFYLCHVIIFGYIPIKKLNITNFTNFERLLNIFLNMICEMLLLSFFRQLLQQFINFILIHMLNNIFMIFFTFLFKVLCHCCLFTFYISGCYVIYGLFLFFIFSLLNL